MHKKLLTPEQEHYCWQEFVEARRTLADIALELGVGIDTVRRGINTTMTTQLREQRDGKRPV